MINSALEFSTNALVQVNVISAADSLRAECDGRTQGGGWHVLVTLKTLLSWKVNFLLAYSDKELVGGLSIGYTAFRISS